MEGESEGDYWIPSYLLRGLDAGNIVYFSVTFICCVILMRQYQLFLPLSRHIIWWIGMCQSMGYISRVVCLGLFLFFFWTGLYIPIPFSLLGSVVPDHDSGYMDTRICPSIVIV